MAYNYPFLFPTYTPLPSAVSGLVLGWDFSSGVTVDGSSRITNVAGAWGTSVALTSPGDTTSPTKVAGLGPNNKDMALFTRTSSTVGQILSFTSTVMSGDFTAFFVIGPKTLTSGATYGFIGKSNASNNYLGTLGVSGNLTSANLQARANGAANTNVAYPFSMNTNLQLVCVIYDKTAGTVTTRINGTGGSTISVGAGGFTFDTLGAIGKTTSPLTQNYFDGYMTAVAVYDHKLSAVDQLIAESALRPYRAAHLFVSSSIGSDSSVTPWNTSTPWSTLAKTTGFAYQYGDTFALLSGDEWAENIVPPTAGITGKRVRWTSYGYGAKPKLYGATKYTSGWTNAGGGLWTRTLAYKPKKCWAISGSTIYHIFDQATSSQWSFTQSASTLTIRLDDVIDPNTIEIRVAANNTTNGFDCGVNNIVAENLDLRYWARTGAAFGSASNAETRNCYIGYNAADGWDASGSSTNTSAIGCEIVGNGVNKTIGTSDGDGVSYHGDSSGIITRCYIHDNLRSGFGSERGAPVIVSGNRITGNNQNVIIYDQSTTSRTAGYLLLINNLIEYTSTDAEAAIDLLQNPGSSGTYTGTAGNWTWLIYGNTIVALTAGTGIGIYAHQSGAVWKGNIIRGFATGSKVEAALTATENYNDYFNNTTARTGPHNGGSGTAGANDISSDPLMTNFAGGVYTITSSSPCRGASIDLGLTYDYAGKARPQGSNYDMGAYQYAA